jgi:hypothetical protein
MCRPSTLIVIGLLLLLVGVLDPMEGSLAILTGTGVIALGAYLSDSAYWRSLTWAFGLVSVGAAGLFVVSALGGVGGDSGQLWWWGLLLLPYAVGWIMSLAGAVLWFVDRLYDFPKGGGNLAPR